MDRTALIKHLATDHRLTQVAVKEILTTIEHLIPATLAVGESVEWFGFGTFTKRAKPARQGRNPRTGEAITIPAREVVVFTPSAAFKRAAAAPE